MKELTEYDGYKLSPDKAEAIFQSFILALLRAMTESSGQHDVLKYHHQQGDLNQRYLRACICIAACIRWEAREEAPDLCITQARVFELLAELGGKRLCINPPPTASVVQRMFEEAQNAMFREQNMNLLALRIGGIVSGNIKSVIENTYWFQNIMNAVEKAQVPITLNR